MSTRGNRRAQAPIAGRLAGANLGGTATGDAVPTAPIPAGRLRAHRMSDALAQMDPRLQRARARQASGARKVSSASTNRDDIAVIAKVTDLDAWNALSEVTEGVRLGERENGTQIVTARIPLSRIEFVRHQPFVVSLKAAQHVHRALASTTSETLSRPQDLGGLPATGKGVVVGVVDFGGDFVHRNFRDSAGKSRLLALWDQGAAGGTGRGANYGVVHRSKELNAALKKTQPYQALGYDVDAEAHGTHVMDIAGGNGLGTKVPGMAPQSKLVFVELSSSDIPWGGPGAAQASFGDSVQLLEAVEFIFREAGDRPCVVNLSLATNGGPHDGSTLAEQGMDRLVRARPNRAVVIAASNSQADGIHASGSVPAGSPCDLRFHTPNQINQEHELELWYAGADRMRAELIAPDGTAIGAAGPGESMEIEDGSGAVVATLANRLKDPGNNDNTISAWLGERMPTGQWTLRLSAARPTAFHAWLERNDGGQASFTTFRTDTHCLGSISCGKESIVVGSYDAHKNSLPISYFSSAGPTRSGAQKPEVCAPGHAVMAALSRSVNKAVGMSGTSMAAPAVTGLVALLLSEAARRKRSLSAADIRSAVISTTRRPASAPAWDPFRGTGRVCGRDALGWLGPQKITTRPTVPSKSVVPAKRSTPPAVASRPER